MTHSVHERHAAAQGLHHTGSRIADPDTGAVFIVLQEQAVSLFFQNLLSIRRCGSSPETGEHTFTVFIQIIDHLHSVFAPDL